MTVDEAEPPPVSGGGVAADTVGADIGERYLYVCAGKGFQWVFNSALTPESGIHWALPTEGSGSSTRRRRSDGDGVPTGEGMEWSVFDGTDYMYVDSELTVEAA